MQRMGPPGTSCVFEVVDDPSFGALVSFGLSGMVSELLGDRAYRVLPLSTRMRRTWSAPRGPRRCSRATGATRRPAWTRWRTSPCA